MNSARPMSTSTERALMASSTSPMVTATPAAPAMPMKNGERRPSAGQGAQAAGFLGLLRGHLGRSLHRVRVRLGRFAPTGTRLRRFGGSGRWPLSSSISRALGSDSISRPARPEWSFTLIALPPRREANMARYFC